MQRLQVRVVHGGLLVKLEKQDEGQNVRAWLLDRLHLSEGFTRKLVANGAVQLGDQTLKHSDVLPASGTLQLTAPKLPLDHRGGLDERVPGDGARGRHPGSGSAGTEAHPYRNPRMGTEPHIQFMDEHLVVVDKPAGWLVHSDGETDTPTLLDWARTCLPSDAAVSHVHRLDRETTGCVLFARHVFAAQALNQAVADKRIDRTYVALLHGVPPREHGWVDVPIGRDRHTQGKYRPSPTGKPASTEYWRLAHNEHLALVQCRLHTGRTHQIRVHMASIHCPVVGDTLYQGIFQPRATGRPAWSGPGHALHAASLAFEHPYTGEDIQVSAAWPEAFNPFLQTLGYRGGTGGTA